MTEQEHVQLEYDRRVFKNLKPDSLNQPDAVARMRFLVDELKMRLLTEAAGDPA